MKDKIKSQLQNARALELLYHSDKKNFRLAILELNRENVQEPALAFWMARLQHESESISWGSSSELVFLLLGALVAGLIMKLPEIIQVKEAFFYPRNMGFIVFPVLTAWFARKGRFSLNKGLTYSLLFICSAVYINLLPDLPKSDSLILACIHLPIFLWFILGSAFCAADIKDLSLRLGFLRFNGELLVICALLLIAGGIMTGLTLGLFSLIGVKIEEFYFRYVVQIGVAAVPLVGTYLVQSNPQLVNRVSPVIARVFTPLVLITLLVYLVAIAYTGKDPYQDRDFLILFNALLLAVIAIILFSIAESSRQSMSFFSRVMLFSLSVLSIVINGIALSAILFRISEWGLSPNRAAVLGSNALIMINLLLVCYRQMISLRKGGGFEDVENSIAAYMPVYGLWSLLVSFTFPLIFSYH